MDALIFKYQVEIEKSIEEMFIDEQLLEIDFSAQNKEQVIKHLSQKLDALGYVQEGFEKAVLEREAEYPTGLPSKIPIALCHVEADYVLKTAMAVATLENPVEFHQMGDPASTLQVEIVFLMTILDPKKQVVYLRKMMQFITAGENLVNLKESASKSQALELLKSGLL